MPSPCFPAPSLLLQKGEGKGEGGALLQAQALLCSGEQRGGSTDVHTTTGRRARATARDCPSARPCH